MSSRFNRRGITGDGGKSLYEFTAPENFQPWSAVYASPYHYVRFDVDGDTMRVSSIATDEPAGEVLDTFTLKAGEGAAPNPEPKAPNPCVGEP